MYRSSITICRVAGYVAILSDLAGALDNGLARTPQMGWNNWNSLGCDVSEGLLINTSKRLVDLGLRDLGYQYVISDDCWSGGRGEDGFQFPDTIKFTNGMKFVSDEIHGLGLRFGIYSSAGELTCTRFSGSLDWEQNDARSFASWGVDYLKYDNCYSRGRYGTPEASFKRFETMQLALNDTGRPVLYSLSSWGEDYVYFWGASVANSWHVTGDIYDSFSRPDILCSCHDPSQPACSSFGAHCSVLYILNRAAAYADRAQPGAWNDLYMLEVGLGGMTDDEYKAHFTMWALLKSPLLIGADLRTLSPSGLTTLNNPAIIAINQDPAGRSARRIHIDYGVKKDKYGIGETQVWSGSLATGDQVVAFLNAADEDIHMACSLDEIFVSEGPGGSAPQAQHEWDVFDLWVNRMDNGVAATLLGASSDGKPEAAVEAMKRANWYNSTALPYSDGLRLGDERLLGKKIGSVKARGELQATVPRHGVAAFRFKKPVTESEEISDSPRRAMSFKKLWWKHSPNRQDCVEAITRCVMAKRAADCR